MTMSEEIAEHSAELCQDLRHLGLDTRPYLRAPVANELFTATIDTRQIRLWLGVTDVSVHGDRKHRQAVLNVTEGARAITRQFQVYSGGRILSDERIMDHFPVAVPNIRKSEVRIIKDNGMWATVEATVHARKNNTSLLMGFDEIRQFIAMLPAGRRVTTVEQAHRALRPQVSAKAVRQGEWFFDPATPAETVTITKALRGRAMPVMAPLEFGSSHQAVIFTLPHAVGEPEPKRFATGVVRDSRVKHHRPLVLDGWYRVVRNTEVEAPAAMRGRQVRTWD